jgi:hypothetical protein
VPEHILLDAKACDSTTPSCGELGRLAVGTQSRTYITGKTLSAYDTLRALFAGIVFGWDADERNFKRFAVVAVLQGKERLSDPRSRLNVGTPEFSQTSSLQIVREPSAASGVRLLLLAFPRLGPALTLATKELCSSHPIVTGRGSRRVPRPWMFHVLPGQLKRELRLFMQARKAIAIAVVLLLAVMNALESLPAWGLAPEQDRYQAR